ncbi:MAG: hypothetical protein AAF368_20200, partial [Planctomycetota bacterium]
MRPLHAELFRGALDVAVVAIEARAEEERLRLVFELLEGRGVEGSLERPGGTAVSRRASCTGGGFSGCVPGDLHHGPVLQDARDVVTRTEYDGLNRVLRRWEDGNKDATLVSWTYDEDPDCPRAECTNTAGRLASLRFPISLGDEIVSGQLSYGHDQRGRVIHTAQTWDGLKLVNKQRLDNINRLAQIMYPDGVSHQMSY